MADSANRQRVWLASARLWQAILAVYWLIAFTATHVPRDFPGVPTGHWDKLAHFGAYAALALLFATTWQLSAGVLIGVHLRFAWLLLVLYGALDEWTQPFVGREASWLDWLADAAGAAVGLLVFQSIAKWICARNHAKEIDRHDPST
jgi:VanZ family protein